MEISRCERMSGKRADMRVVVAAIAAAILGNGGGENISPSLGRESRNDWSTSHRRMVIGKGSLVKKRSDRGTKR